VVRLNIVTILVEEVVVRDVLASPQRGGLARKGKENLGIIAQ